MAKFAQGHLQMHRAFSLAEKSILIMRVNVYKAWVSMALYELSFHKQSSTGYVESEKLPIDIIKLFKYRNHDYRCHPQSTNLD